MSKSARFYAHTALKKVLTEGAFLNMALKDLPKLSMQDIAMVTKLTNTVLENINQIDYVLAPLIKQKRVHSTIKLILCMATCEALFLRTPQRAVVFEAVNLATEIGKGQLKGFVNAVLRRLLEIKDTVSYPDENEDFREYLRVFSGYPVWYIDEVLSIYGNNFAKNFLLYKPDNTKTHVRLNTHFGPAKRLLGGLQRQGLKIGFDDMFEEGAQVLHLNSIASQPAFTQGNMTIMGKASMLCTRLTKVEMDTKVLDACAAPGGKTAYLSALMQNTGQITAWDIHEHRVALIEKNIQRLGCTNVKASQKDATVYDASLNETFDLVFLDLPCSSMGLAYKKADVRLNKTAEDIKSLATLQRDIINATKNYVKPGGTLMITTCSVTQAESDLAWFFKKNKNFTEQKLDMPKGMEYLKKTHGVQLFPHISHMDGFFICKMKKESC